MTDQELKDLVASLAVSQAETYQQIQETNKQMKETDKQMKETDRKLKSIGIRVGNISNNQGAITEEFFINSLSTSLKVAGIQYDQLHKNMNRRTKKIQGEFDIVLINGKDIAIIEIKYKAHDDDLDDLINKKFTRFKELFPEYNNYNYHLGLASFYISDDLRDKALNNNVFILQRKGDIIESFYNQ